MSGPAWFSLGLAAGINLTVALASFLNRLDARAHQYVRPAGSPAVVRISGRNPA